MKGCRDVRDWDTLSRQLPRLARLNLSWSGIMTLPCTADDDRNDCREPSASNDSGFFELADLDDAAEEVLKSACTPFQSLRHLSLSSTPALTAITLASFIAYLPPLLESLDLSHTGLLPHTLEPLTRSTLELNGDLGTPRLARLNVRGNDALTLTDVRRLEQSWLRRTGYELQVKHTAVLESEGEDDVRRFVELVAGSGVARREGVPTQRS